ncbi:hypothetical protein [Paenibacillus alkalitolerans]|uniref:hypothetical protein n=1 Tax=Paenibacillus alkalitolerans TaxID=2799335 RepID=UPI0018F5FA65|nr:hypothetical protein [Paenibacillus alkalitolerans]
MLVTYFSKRIYRNTIEQSTPWRMPLLRDLRFPYGQQEVDDAVTFRKNRGKPIAWAVEDHGNYYWPASYKRCLCDLATGNCNATRTLIAQFLAGLHYPLQGGIRYVRFG